MGIERAQSVLEDLKEGVRRGRCEKVKSFLSFLFEMLCFSDFTSFQAESLLLRRKVWRGNDRGGGGGGEGGDQEGGRLRDKPQQEAAVTHRTHTLSLRVCTRSTGRDCASN